LPSPVGYFPRTVYIPGMSNKSLTYHLGPDFEKKLDKFIAGSEAQWFETFATEFANLDDFISKAEADQSDRKDLSLRRSKRILYMLEAVSYRIQDRLNRKAFNRAKNTIIIMPDCLTLHNPDCLKTDEEWGDRCQRCLPDCQAYQVLELADQYGIEAIYSKRKLSEQITHYAGESDELGVIGIACLMMLAEGMRTAAQLSVPARGVLLSFSGCEHWNDVPFTSEFDMEKLESILEEKYG